MTHHQNGSIVGIELSIILRDVRSGGRYVAYYTRAESGRDSPFLFHVLVDVLMVPCFLRAMAYHGFWMRFHSEQHCLERTRAVSRSRVDRSLLGGLREGRKDNPLYIADDTTSLAPVSCVGPLEAAENISFAPLLGYRSSLHYIG